MPLVHARLTSHLFASYEFVPIKYFTVSKKTIWVTDDLNVSEAFCLTSPSISPVKKFIMLKKKKKWGKQPKILPPNNNRC